MTMFARLTTLFGWRKADDERACTTTDASIVPSPTTRKRSFDKVNQYLEKGALGNEQRSSRLGSPAEMSASKRIKLFPGKGHTAQSHSTSLSPSPTQNKTKAKGKRLMPPPAIPKSKQPRNRIRQTPSPRTPASKAEDADTKSIKSDNTTTSVKHRPDDKDRFDAERAARYADACALPPNSGVWSEAEHQLFYHIAMRGYDPLVPENWMKDFKTLPVALFAYETDDIPLITPIYSTEFRAIKALRDLFETGKLLRDKVLSTPGCNIEHILRTTIERYINWGMKDAGIPRTPSVLPVHRIAVRKHGQKTSDLIDELESDLYDLAQQHRDERGIVPSIEVPPSSPIRNSGDPSIADNPEGLPTLIGMIITYGILVVFTLNPNIKKIKAEPGSSPDDEEMGIRYIARFDFSDSGMDVWNGFAVAIVCMILRKIQIERGVAIDPAEVKKEGKRKGKGIRKSGKASVRFGDGVEDEVEDEDPDL